MIAKGPSNWHSPFSAPGPVPFPGPGMPVAVGASAIMIEVVELIALEAVSMVGDGIIVAITAGANGASNIEVDPYWDVTDVAVESNVEMAPIDKEADEAAVVGDRYKPSENLRTSTSVREI